ncbi:MAG: 50S ribosomal protein L17 [Candidatus Buchananbacteria bacterium]
MRHRKKDKILSRTAAPKKALLRSLVTSLVVYESIKTTQAKAKAAQKIVEKVITLGKKKDLASRRQILTIVYGENPTKKVMDVLAPRFEKRVGGYTRIVKVGRRLGDAAEMVKLEFV